jgi:hypothetical protein
MSDTCANCGGEIIFRYMDGRVTPIHLSGSCSSDYAGSTATGVRSAPAGFDDDFCRSTTCPQCGARVFFIRHNGGSVWVDELGWPWPKHGCFDTAPATPRSRRAFSVETPSGERSADLLLGLVVWAELESPGQTGLLIKRQDRAMFRYRVRGNRLDLVGEVVAIPRFRQVLTSSLPGHEVVPVIHVEAL